MNLGDGLKLETEVLDGKPRLILAYSDKSKPAMKMGNKARAPKQALRIRHTGHVLRSTQNACIRQENLAKPRSESSLSMTKGEKLQVTNSSHEGATKDHFLIFQRENTNRYPDSENPNVVEKSNKPQNPCVSAEDLRSFVCLTQEQLQQILMAVKEGTRSISETHNETEEMATNEASEENIIGLLQKACEVSSVPDEAISESSRKQEAYLQPGQKVLKIHGKPADMFSTLDEKKREALLEFRKTQWKKELALGNVKPLKVGNAEKAAKNSALEHNQKVSFLRSMTALLDPAQIEERDRRRQKQLEHQKAIMAQIEEKRKKKQLEEEQRRQEQEEEQRLAREKEQMQKFEEDMLKQKQKEELVTLNNELYQTMQKAQELAQRLKQEQRIRDLAQKGHDISKLQKNLGGGDTEFENCNTGTSHQSHNFSDDIKSHIDQETSPRKDTAVQTDYFNTSAYTESAEERTVCCESPDISIEYKETSNSKKYQKEMQYIDKNKLSGKETGAIYSDLYEQYARKEKQIKPSEKYSKRPDWNIKKPGKRYVPASERYPKQLQKQRENKVRRQMELLQLVERNTPGNLSKKGGYSGRSPSPHEEINTKSKGHRVRKEEQLHKNHLTEERSESPPVPAVKNRLHQVQQKQIHTSNFLVHNNNSRREKNSKTETQQRSSLPPITEAGRPPSSQFIPYVRTSEVYYLDPEAPVTRPSTQDPQYRQFNDSYQAPQQIFSSDHVRDPLLNPDVVKIRERQQAILKGLSELRQGLLRKQKELETALIPAIAQEENFISPF
ncbi:LOW QUALITY PROTEIN: coiled-coil domain-containing protein 66 [Cariama cristata]